MDASKKQEKFIQALEEFFKTPLRAVFESHIQVSVQKQ